MAKKIGTATGIEISPEKTTYKMHSIPQNYNVPDRYSEQIRLSREWDEKMEFLNEEYGFDYYSSSVSDSDFETEHKYETFI